MNKVVFIVVMLFFSTKLSAQVVGSTAGLVTAAPIGTVVPQQQVIMTQQTGITQAANQQTAALNRSAQLNTMLGVMLLSQCMSGKSPNMMMCMLGAYALAQGMNAQQAAQQSAQTASVSTVQAPVVANIAPVTLPATTVTGANPLVANLPATAQTALKKLTAAGYSVSSDGVTDSSGKQISMPALNSKEQLTQYGLDQKTVSSVQRTIASTYEQPRE